MWFWMLIRSALAAIDFNANIKRKAEMTADVKPRYKMKVCLAVILHLTKAGRYRPHRRTFYLTWDIYDDRMYKKNRARPDFVLCNLEICNFYFISFVC